MPKDFVPASWRGTTAINPETGSEIGVSFDSIDGSVVRLAIDITSAKKLADSLNESLATRVGV